jgi:DNA-binding NarL/FixJ family response regulator
MANRGSDEAVEIGGQAAALNNAKALPAAVKSRGAKTQANAARKRSGGQRRSSRSRLGRITTGPVPVNGEDGWSRLKQALDGLAYPAWLEAQDGEIIFSNFHATEGQPLSLAAIYDLRAALNDAEQVRGVRVHDLRRGWIEVSVSAHPVAFAVKGAAGGANARLLVACLAGEEVSLDRQLIGALLGLIVDRDSDAAQASLQQLTSRQRAIFRLLNANLSYKEIAAELGLAHATVRVQVAEMRKRLGARMVPTLRRVSN